LANNTNKDEKVKKQDIIMNKIVKTGIIWILLVNIGCNSSNPHSEKGSPESEPTPNTTSEEINFKVSCNYAGVENENRIVGFFADEEAENALKRIMKYTGLPANFTIRAANVSNACAVIDGSNRYILYSQEFMEKQDNWAKISILAHEIGHHLSGHTLEAGGSRPPIELEADKFSGFVLAKMGATADESLIAIKRYASDEYSLTHPSKSARIAAIMNGWKQANETANQPNKPNNPDIINPNVSSNEIIRISKNEIEGFLSNWVNSQNYKMINEYVNLYSNQFQGIKRTPSGGVHYYDYVSWLVDRRRMILVATNLNVQIGDIQIIDEDFNGITLKFIQKYSSDRFKDIGEKILKINKNNFGEIRIIYEEMLNSYKDN
jgi:hypothetical protein